MNPKGNSTGRLNNSSNENETSHPLSIESLEMLPLLPQMNIPQEEDNNNGPSTNVPLLERPNVASGSNSSPSSSIVATPQNPATTVDLSSNLDIPNEGATISSAVTSSTNAEASYEVQVTSNMRHLPTKRSSSSEEFVVGESSNMAEQASLAKRRETDHSRVSTYNNGNPSSSSSSPPPPPPPQQPSPPSPLPPPRPVVQQVHQFISESEHTEPIRGHHHVNTQNAGSITPSPNPRVNRFASNHRRGSQAPLHNQAGLYHSRASQHSFQPLGFPSRSSYITVPQSIVNTISVRNAPHTIIPIYPYPETDIMAQLHGQGSTMFGQVGNSFGNFPTTYGPNQSYFVNDGVVGMTPSFDFPQWFDPLEPVQFLSGNVNPAVTYHPLSEQAGPSTSRGSRRMNHSAAASSSRTRNYHNQMQISGSGIPPFVHYEPSFPIPQFPPEVQLIVDYLQNSGRALMLEYYPYEDVMVVEYALPIRTSEQTVNLEQIDESLPAGLSVETIMQHLKHETFVSVDGENPEDKDRCPICLEDFEDGDEIGKLHSCLHKFHVHCIKQWLMHRNSCAICKRVALETNNVNASEP